MNIFDSVLDAMPDKAWAFNRGPQPDPCIPVRPPEPPADEAQDAPETSAPGAPLDETELASPPAGDGSMAEAPGAVDSEPEAVSDEVAAQVREGIAASERGETVDLGSFVQYASDGEGEAPGA